MHHDILPKTILTRLALTSLIMTIAAPVALAQNQTPERTRAASSSSTHTGEVLSTADGQLTMTINGENRHSHKVNNETRITLDGQQTRLQDLQRGDTVKVTMGENNVAREIVATRSQPEVKPRVEPRDSEATPQAQSAQVFLGIAIEPSEGAGVFIPEVAIDSPAEKAGIRGGDYILSINGTKVSSPEELDQNLAKLQPGEQAKLVTWRDGQKHEVTAMLIARQASGYRPYPVDDEDNSNPDADDEPAAWLGVLLTEPEGQTEGVKIEQVHPEGPAAEAGVKTGDILTRINDQQIASAENATQMLASLKPGTKVDLALMRDGERQTVTVTLGDRTKFFSNTSSDSNSQYTSDEVPEHFMMIEQHRQFAKQHERIEELCYQLLDEVKSLRKEVQELKNNRATGN